MRGQGDELAVANGDAHARIRHGHDAACGLAWLAEVRHKALPQLGHVQFCGRCGRHPAVERADDVRVGVRGQDGRELRWREVARHRQVQLAVGQVAARIDDGAGVFVDDEELVGLNGLASFVAQVREHQADVVTVAIELQRHGRLLQFDEPQL
jgi:hypothetical protein